MKRTSLKALVAVAGFLVAAFAIVTPAFYGNIYSIPVTVSVTLWLMTVVCVMLAFKVRAAKKDDGLGIGLDRSQLNPMTVANFMLVGKASAWTGAVVAGAYGGIGCYVFPRVNELAAAADDLWGVIFCISGGVAMAASGYYLEGQCEAPPPPDGVGA
ncbi:hypothetical protein CPHO_10695 [Corynebacterium phocae]|uniref:DUF3180 domain-containing protein n=1 Tax=Corynebacterium phocae TaxID=161895 RepID=A0A1L7D564_9CORY|nr:DUF3180 domain-containing protein [Corynebacterium phocae]APT93279.1 hypothetical protein CPHO_10695 [Corynebacterium phocae]KAA8721607.1 DUF3180 domain-containing protein [Corynebacterium phocae]